MNFLFFRSLPVLLLGFMLSSPGCESASPHSDGPDTASTPPSSPTGSVNADFDISTEQPRCPATIRLIAAAQSGDLTVAMLEDLISAGADVGATRLPSGGNPVLILTITGPYNPDVVVIVERMLDAGADVNQANVNGVTAVAAAAAFSEQSVGLVGLLLERGADPNIIQRSGANLLFATMFGSACEDLIPLVLASPIPVDLSHRFKLKTILEAAISSCPSVCDLLLEHGATADPFFRLKSGDTILEVAKRGDYWAGTKPGPMTMAYLEGRAAKTNP
jgi:hypothetical protein